MSADSASVQLLAKTSLSASLNAEAALSAQLGAGAAVVNDYLIQTEEIEDGHRLTITRGSEVQSFDLKNGAPGSNDAVLYTPQTLTTEQQVQARANVGAASAERVEAMENTLPGKLTEPAEGLAVGKYFRVAALDENGHAVLEAVDAPKEGLALTPTGWPEWTADEQAAARERMGLDKEWVLKGTLTTENKDDGVGVDLIGCTELFILGLGEANGNSSLKAITATETWLFYNVFTNTIKGFAARWVDTYQGIDCITTSTTTTGTVVMANGGQGYNWYNKAHVADITKVLLSKPSAITQCKIEIWAR